MTSSYVMWDDLWNWREKEQENAKSSVTEFIMIRIMNKK